MCARSVVLISWNEYEYERPRYLVGVQQSAPPVRHVLSVLFQIVTQRHRSTFHCPNAIVARINFRSCALWNKSFPLKTHMP